MPVNNAAFYADRTGMASTAGLENAGRVLDTNPEGYHRARVLGVRAPFLRQDHDAIVEEGERPIGFVAGPAKPRP